MEVDIAGMTATLDARTMTVKMQAPAIGESGPRNVWSKQGIEVVLLFGILVALTKTPEKSK